MCWNSSAPFLDKTFCGLWLSSDFRDINKSEYIWKLQLSLQQLLWLTTASEVKSSSERSENCLSKQCKYNIRMPALKYPVKSLSQAHHYVECSETYFGMLLTICWQLCMRHAKAYCTQCLKNRIVISGEADKNSVEEEKVERVIKRRAVYCLKRKPGRTW